jgi:caffeoyl-CoA O-methyltransferase
MNPSLFAQVDAYITDLTARHDHVLNAAVVAADAAGLPPIAVSASQGKLLQVLARACGAKRILEIGTLGGYSTIWLARALPPDGKLVTLEFEPKHAEVARANFVRAGLDGQIDLRLGKALYLLPQLEAEGAGPFDFIFIDADKPPYPDYFGWALRLSRPGTLIVADNVIRGGRVLDPDSPDGNVPGVRRLNAMLADNPAITATILQIVGAKEHDGMVLAVVNG